jgi:hypothetical protein
MKSTKAKRKWASILQLKFVKKYNFLSTAKPFFPSSMIYGRECGRRVRGFRRRKMEMVKVCVHAFYEDDEVTTMAPGKNDFIKRKNVRKQKRYLNQSLKYLYRRFCEVSEFTISYNTFCRLRPFWVVDRKLSARDTCLCIKHENIQLMHSQLRELSIFNDRNLDIQLEREMCCETVSEECLFRKCVSCSEKMMQCDEFDGSKKTFYDTWEKITENGFVRTVKNRKECLTYELVDIFFNHLSSYMEHLGKIRQQYTAIKN